MGVSEKGGISPNGGFLSHRGTPSYHPFEIGIFHEINHPFLDGIFHEINHPFLDGIFHEINHPNVWYPHDYGNPREIAI